MVETTYHKDKVYVPRDVQEKLGLKEGDRIHIEVVDSGEARLRVVGSAEASKRILERLKDPPKLGRVLGGLTRRDIYEDNAGHQHTRSRPE